MLWSGYQPFGTAQHMRHFHQMIVDNICKMVCRESVRFDYNWVALITHINASFTENQVCEFKYRFGFQLKPESDVRNAFCCSHKEFNHFMLMRKWQTYRMHIGSLFVNFSATCTGVRCLHRLSYFGISFASIASLRNISTRASVQKQ